MRRRSRDGDGGAAYDAFARVEAIRLLSFDSTIRLYVTPL
jgi:hypothetical protein